MRETWVRSLGWEDPLEKEMAIHSSTLAWKIPRMVEPDSLQSMGSQRVGHNWATSLYTLLFNFIETKRIFIREEGFQFNVPFTSPWASLVTQMVKNPPAHAGNSSLILGLGRCPGEGLSDWACTQGPSCIIFSVFMHKYFKHRYCFLGGRGGTEFPCGCVRLEMFARQPGDVKHTFSVPKSKLEFLSSIFRWHGPQNPYYLGSLL